MVTHPSGLFQETKCRPLGVLAPQIFAHTRDWPRLSSTHPKLGWGSSKYFKCEHWKISLKFITKVSITLGLVAITIGNFCRRHTAQ